MSDLEAIIARCERELPGFRWEVGATLSPGYGAHLQRRTNAVPHGYIESGGTPAAALLNCLHAALAGEGLAKAEAER